MIQQKKKLCSICNNLEYLWSSKNGNVCIKCKSVKPIKKVSDKHKETLKEYKVIREEFLKNNPNCQLKLQGCSIIASEVHHKIGKSSEELYLNPKFFMSVCRNCHTICEEMGITAYEKGWKIHKNQINEI